MTLEETSRLMRTQDNRGTQFPLFIIQEQKEVMTANGRGDRTIYFNSEDQVSITADQYEELEEARDSDKTDEEVAELLEDVGMDSLGEFEADDWERLEINDEYVFADQAGFFFTEKACHDHIESNHYHYTKPRSYVISAWRNPEMVATMQMILKLTGDDIPNHYK